MGYCLHCKAAMRKTLIKNITNSAATASLARLQYGVGSIQGIDGRILICGPQIGHRIYTPTTFPKRLYIHSVATKRKSHLIQSWFRWCRVGTQSLIFLDDIHYPFLSKRTKSLLYWSIATLNPKPRNDLWYYRNCKHVHNMTQAEAHVELSIQVPISFCPETAPKPMQFWHISSFVFPSPFLPRSSKKRLKAAAT